ncbi:MAG: PilZ domain-containing protein [Bdellovibrionales bacterium]|nr:PilZ domain-containing protein [Bdellovibrionales bacterium]
MGKKEDNRGRARLEAKVRIRIIGVDEKEEVYTGNVSKEGIFIQTRNWKPQIGHPVQMLLTLDEDKEPVKFAGTVVRVIDANQWGKPEGVAIEFSKIESKKTKEFDQFLDSIFEGKGLGCRKSPRAMMKIEVEIKNKKIAQNVLTQDLSKGGAFFVMKTADVEMGALLDIVLVHPTSKRKFVLKGEVVHIRTGSSNHPDFVEGVGVQFIDLSEIRRQDLQVFLKSIVSSKRRKTSKKRK